MATPDDIVEIRPSFFVTPPVIRLDSQAGRDFLVRSIREDGIESFEKPALALFTHLVTRLGGTILDIGANTGIYALMAAAAHAGARVCAFEPLAKVHQMLRRNVALNPQLQPRIMTCPFGFSDKAGTSVFYETINPAGFISTSSSLERSHAECVGRFREHQIALRSLDEWLPGLCGDRVSVVKIDVEGHEHAVLEGGRNMLAVHRPIMLVEMLTLSHFDTIHQLMVEHQYAGFAVAETTLRHYTMPSFHDDAWNHVLCPVESIHLVLELCRSLGLGVALTR